MEQTFISHLAAPRTTLGYFQGDSLFQPILITASYCSSNPWVNKRLIILITASYYSSNPRVNKRLVRRLNL